LTQGRYTRVWRPLDREELWVDLAAGTSLPVERLSHGTRELLFFSLRLALASAYARRGVRLPMILDDVMVNFDTVRAQAAAALLRDFAQEGKQILLFTCHEHLLKLFQQLRVPQAVLPDWSQHPLPKIRLEIPAAEKRIPPRSSKPPWEAPEPPEPSPPPEEPIRPEGATETATDAPNSDAAEAEQSLEDSQPQASLPAQNDLAISSADLASMPSASLEESFPSDLEEDFQWSEALPEEGEPSDMASARNPPARFAGDIPAVDKEGGAAGNRIGPEGEGRLAADRQNAASPREIPPPESPQSDSVGDSVHRRSAEAA